MFRAVFFGDAKEKATGYMHICDMHPDMFPNFLRFDPFFKKIYALPSERFKLIFGPCGSAPGLMAPR